MKINEVQISKQEVENVFSAAANKAKKGGLFGLGKRNISVQDLERTWATKYYKSTDHNDIIHMLTNDFGFNKKDIMPILNAAHKDEPIKKLARSIKAHGLEKQAIEIIDRLYKTVKESIVLEKHISDKDIKQLFVQLVQQSSATADENGSVTVNDYVKKWASEIKKAPTPEEKVNLVKEIVNFLADRHTTQEWQNVKKGVQDIISNSGVDPEQADDAIQSINQGVTMEKVTYELCNTLLTECGIQWQQLGVIPVEIDECISLKFTVLQRETLLEDFFTDLINLDKIQKLQEMKTYGRHKKS